MALRGHYPLRAALPRLAPWIRRGDVSMSSLSRETRDQASPARTRNGRTRTPPLGRWRQALGRVDFAVGVIRDRGDDRGGDPLPSGTVQLSKAGGLTRHEGRFWTEERPACGWHQPVTLPDGGRQPSSQGHAAAASRAGLPLAAPGNPLAHPDQPGGRSGRVHVPGCNFLAPGLEAASASLVGCGPGLRSAPSLRKPIDGGQDPSGRAWEPR
jgi:hypothetical protein